MRLTPAHIVELSRLLDQALTLDRDRRDTWLDGLPPPQQPYVPRLRDMLARQARMDDEPLLATLPRLDMPEADEAGAGDRIGPYRLLRPLGRGGMSVVWLAERADAGPKRQVAIKLPLLRLNTPRQQERFARERDMLAGLEHAHIARLYDAGVGKSGRPYLVLEYVDGVPLTRYCEERGLPLAGRLGLFLQVLGAVEYAHAHLVVHRDIKPANILVDAQGQVKLLDFGIAKLLPGPGEDAGAATATLHAGWAMTPLYASPEQLQGQAVTTATDVYALGVVLYELLTRAWPYTAALASPGGPRTLPVVMRAVLDAEPLRPSAAVPTDDTARYCGGLDARRLAGALRGDLDTIVLKALSKPPCQRYRSAERLADDLRRYLARQPIAARPPSWVYQARMFVSRHRSASLAAATAMGLAVVFGATAWQHQERAVIMRDFLAGLFDDVEPDSRQADQPVTALQMLDRAAARARSDYGDKPRLQGELLGELGRMYLQLGEPGRAQPLLGDALAQLTHEAPVFDPTLNMTQALLAGLLLEYGAKAEHPRGMALANEAIRRCGSPLPECARVRAEALSVLGMTEANLGRFEAALPLYRRAAAEASLGYGEGNGKTLQYLNDAAVTARNAGLFMEAERALGGLVAAAEDRSVRAATRTNVLLLKARIDCDLGRYDRALQQVQELIAQSPGHSGPALEDRGRSRSNDQLVGLLRLQATALLEQGDPLAARQAINSAMALFRPEQRATDVLYARQVQAQARGLLAPSDAALDELQAVTDGLLALGQSPQASTVLRARRMRAELLARQGRLSQARDELAAVAGPAEVPRPAVLQGVVLDQLGSVLRELGQPALAASRHEAARVLLLQALPAEHPYLARNALYLEAARVAAAGRRADQAALLVQAEHYKSLFPANSLWRRLVDRYLAPGCAALPQGTDCLLLL
jgi:serine/threonine protein kinase